MARTSSRTALRVAPKHLRTPKKNETAEEKEERLKKLQAWHLANTRW